jgi:chromate transporter
MDSKLSVSVRESVAVWLKVAFLSFGGPAAQIALMQRLVVEEKGWLEQDRFNHALNFCMLLPGPEAQQLATYVGWLLDGVRGGLLAGLLFILPGALIMLALSLLYVTIGQAGPVEGLLFGLKCAVLAIVAQALVRMAGKVVHGFSGLALSVLAFIAMFFFALPFPLVILLSGLIGLWLFSGDRPALDSLSGHQKVGWQVPVITIVAWLLPLLLLALVLGRDSLWTELAGFFSLMAVVSFGGAYAILAWVAQFAAETRDWITAAEMLDGLGLAETTPGPLILVTQFVGFLAAWRHESLLHPLLAGSLGGLLTTWVMFAPSFLWIFLLAPQVEKLRANVRLSSALKGITAAVVGVIAYLALWFGLRLLFSETRRIENHGLNFESPVFSSLDPWALGLSLTAALLLFVLRLNLLASIAIMAGAGLTLHFFGMI